MSKIRNYGILGLVISWSCISLCYGYNPFWLLQLVEDDCDTSNNEKKNKIINQKVNNKKQFCLSDSYSDSDIEISNNKKKDIIKELENLNLDNLSDREIADLYKDLKKQKIIN